MKKKNIRVYVIIVTYNGMRWIDNCLGSLRKSSIPLKTIVVDNQSSDETVDYIRKYYSEVDLIVSKKNSGFGHANNIGLKKAYDEGADYIYLLNQDAWIMPDTLEKMVNIMDNNPEVGILSPMQLDATKQNVDKLFLKDLIMNYSTTSELLSNFIIGELKAFYPLGYFPAAHWLLSRKCIEDVGLFSPAFFHYGEDVNYIKRAHYHGIKSFISPYVIAIHDRGKRKKLDMLGKIFNQYNNSIEEASNIELNKVKHLIYLVKFVVVSIFYFLFIKVVCVSNLEIKQYYKILTPLSDVIKFYKMSKRSGFLLNTDNDYIQK